MRQQQRLGPSADVGHDDAVVVGENKTVVIRRPRGVAARQVMLEVAAVPVRNEDVAVVAYERNLPAAPRPRRLSAGADQMDIAPVGVRGEDLVRAVAAARERESLRDRSQVRVIGTAGRRNDEDEPGRPSAHDGSLSGIGYSCGSLPGLQATSTSSYWPIGAAGAAHRC